MVPFSFNGAMLFRVSCVALLAAGLFSVTRASKYTVIEQCFSAAGGNASFSEMAGQCHQAALVMNQTRSGQPTCEELDCSAHKDDMCDTTPCRQPCFRR